MISSTIPPSTDFNYDSGMSNNNLSKLYIKTFKYCIIFKSKF